MQKYLLLVLSAFTIGCNSSKKDTYTYFGGKIINPKGKFVIISDHKGIIDSIKLDKDNSFLGEFKNITAGLYYFKHGSEHQYIYLEPNDSLLLRLNTWDFDESLVFSGKQANRNNTLIEAFLQNENDEKNFYAYYDLKYDAFKEKIDSLEKEKTLFLEEYQSRSNETSKDFLTLLEIATMYPLYRKIESYSLHNFEKGNQDTTQHNNMYAYRDKIVFGLDSLMFFAPYNDMIISQIYNDTYLEGHKKFTDGFNSSILKQIDRRIKNQKLKDKLLKQATISLFYNNPNCKTNQSTFNTFLDLCKTDDYRSRIKFLISDIKNAQKGEVFTNFKINSFDNSKKDIIELVDKKKSVIYFRSNEKHLNDWIAQRINYLITNNSDITFFIVNINEDNNGYINKIKTQHQYYLSKESKAHTFLTSKYSRAILLDEKGIIQNDFGGISSKNIEKQITELCKKQL